MTPFFLGRQMMRRPEDSIDIMRALVLVGLIYSLPMLFEIRMSPQLNTWIYGYLPKASFAQEARGGGFRPVVFVGHGLLLAFFTMTTVVAAATLSRLRIRVWQLPAGAVMGYLSVLLLLCKTLSALLYATLLVPVVRWASPRMQIRVALFLVAVTLSYPILRIDDRIPTDSILKIAHTISVDREQSLKTRFDNEQQLLDKAWQRKWFGWGRYGRSRIYDDDGKDISTTDGFWIITLGGYGLVGFAALFGLLAFTIFRAATALKYAGSKQDAALLAAQALLVAIYMINLVPNSAFYPWTWLLVGSLLGRAEQLRATAEQPAPRRELKLAPVGSRSQVQRKA